MNKIDGRVLWANLFLLFWMSLIPFVSGWMGENHFEGLTVTMYGVVLLMTAVGYYVLTLSLLKSHSSESIIHQAVGNKMKERISLVTYVKIMGQIFCCDLSIAFGLHKGVKKCGVRIFFKSLQFSFHFFYQKCRYFFGS